MNETPQSTNSPGDPLPIRIPKSLRGDPPPARPISYWLKRFLACNPFYLVSAGLLLYGFYRISTDTRLFPEEAAQLAFNLSALELYEILLVLTGILLARRSIWYDSTLLTVLENGFVLVPFILISQAALIKIGLVWSLCLGAGLVALARAGALIRFIPQLNLPPGARAAGLAILAANVGLPIVYRVLHESKVGTNPDWGAAYHMNQYAWLLVLPLLCAFANLVPVRASGELPSQRRGLPLGMFSLWLTATGVHLYCLGYVYDFRLRPELLAPAVWVLFWTLWRRTIQLSRAFDAAAERTLLVLPFFSTFLAAWQPSKVVFISLTILNAAIYGILYLSNRNERFTLHLHFVCLVALIGGLPGDWVRSVAGEYSRAKCIFTALAVYSLVWVPLSRNPKLGLLGGVICSMLTRVAMRESPNALDWGIQVGLAFVLVHSLRWMDDDHRGAAFVRFLLGGAWLGHTWIWLNTGAAIWPACAVAGPVFGLYFVARFFEKEWGPLIVPGAAMLVLLSGPVYSTSGKLQTTSEGLLAVLGSFVLFGLGTLIALTKHRWHNAEPASTQEFLNTSSRDKD